jgi:hypothetical protein
MRWVEASLLELLDLKNFNFCSLKLDLQKYGLVWTGTSGTGSGFLVF